MIQRGIGVIVGAVVTFLLLVLLVPGDGVTFRLVGDAVQGYLVAVVVGALVAFFWPVVIGWWLGRRDRRVQQDRIESEVQRQLDEERRRDR